MTDPHSRDNDEPKKPKHPAANKSSGKAPARGKSTGMGDPHIDDRPERNDVPAPKKATSSSSRRKKGPSADPHGVPDDFTPPYEGSPEREAKYPAGAGVCTSADWDRVILTVAMLKKADPLKKGVWSLIVDAGGREKKVWVDGDLSGLEKLVGGNIVILDNLEPTKVQGKTFNGKAVAIGGSLLGAPSGAALGERIH